MNRVAAAWVARRLGESVDAAGRYHLSRSITANALLRLVQEILGSDMTLFPSGEMLIWNVARHEGYDIPSYPLAGCGDSREFLRDFGVSDVPGWYERVGVTREQSSEFWRYACVMARNEAFWRRVFVIPFDVLDDVSLEADALADVLRFCLGEDDGASDGRLFRC